MELWLCLALFLFALALHVMWWRRCRGLRQTLAQQSGNMDSMQVKHQREVLENSAQQKALFNSMSEGVLVLDRDRNIQLVNRSLQKMFSLAEDVRGQNLEKAFALDELTRFLDRLGKDRTVEGYELTLPRPHERMLEINASAILDTSGTQSGSILVFHDLTRIHQLENTRQEFVANVSHELRTPLSLIKGYVETLLDGAVDDKDLSVRFLQTIEKHANRLTFLIEDILTISKLEDGQIAMNLHPLNLHEEVTRVIGDLKSVADERSVTIANQTPGDLVALADAGRLEQVFFNLIENAIKYGRKHGQVQVGGQLRSDGMLEIWVKDDGPGIPSDSLDRVFERFYRVDRARSRDTGGTGLGLSIVKHIVQGHGGEVWVKSEPGQGSTFFLTLKQS